MCFSFAYISFYFSTYFHNVSLLMSLDWGVHIFYDNFKHNMETEPQLPWQPHQCAILTDCQSLGIDYYDIILQKSHSICDFLEFI